MYATQIAPGNSVTYLDEEDLLPCRCGGKPELKGDRTVNGCGNTRVQCGTCGVRTGMSTNPQGNFEKWNKVMGDA